MSVFAEYLGLFLLILLALSGCDSNAPADLTGSNSNSPGAEREKKRSGYSTGSETESGQEEKPPYGETSEQKTRFDQPRNVRQFFMLLPDDMFAIESCDLETEKLCQKAKAAYLKKYATVEDLKNGYLEAGGDGAQSSFKMAIFKRPDGSYLIALHVLGETQNSSSFHDFSEGRWEDISIEVVPEFSSSNIYELPRFGTRVAVFAKRIIEQRQDFEISEKGEKLYDLKWENGEFSIER